MADEETEVNELILQKLQEYGDSVLEDQSKKSKTKHAAQHLKEKQSRTGYEGKLAKPSSTSLSERQKKKRRKQKKKGDKNLTETSEPSDQEEQVDDSEKEVSAHERRLREMSEQLGLTEFKQEMEKQKKEQEEKEKKKKEHQPEVVVFTSHRSKKQKKLKSDEQSPSAAQGPDFNMREARFDVHKFGIKGFQGNQKEEAMTALLIKLGAKPPKKKYLNYKEYQEKRKQEMIEEKQKREMDRKLGFKIPKADRGKKRPKDKNDVGVIDGQVGRWKSGVQIISKDDLKGWKKPKLK